MNKNGLSIRGGGGMGAFRSLEQRFVGLESFLLGLCVISLQFYKV